LLKVPLYVQVLLALLAGVLLGIVAPGIATNAWIKFFGTAFVHMVKMIIAPIIFCTIVGGIAHVQDAAKVGRVALKAILYFEVFSTLALGLGLVMANVVQPGKNFGARPDEAAVDKYVEAGKEHSAVAFVLGIIPETAVSAFSGGNILQVLFISILFGFSLMRAGERASHVQKLIEETGHVVFGIIAIIMKAAPLGAFGAMAFTIGKYGAATLSSLLWLILLFYATALLFIIVVLGLVALAAGFNIFRFLAYIKDELMIVLATSSSESALPSLMEKIEQAGCSRSVVGLVVPLGYSFNLDGTNIYMTLASLFIAQAMGVALSFGEQMYILAIAMLTSKGASGVSGAGFITLAATLSSVRPELVPGMAVLLSIDKFMSECRALTNIIGNGVACVVISRWEGELDRKQLHDALHGQSKHEGEKACESGLSQENESNQSDDDLQPV